MAWWTRSSLLLSFLGKMLIALCHKYQMFRIFELKYQHWQERVVIPNCNVLVAEDKGLLSSPDIRMRTFLRVILPVLLLAGTQTL